MIHYSPLKYFHYLQPHVNNSFGGQLNSSSHCETLNLAYFPSHEVSRKNLQNSWKVPAAEMIKTEQTLA